MMHLYNASYVPIKNNIISYIVILRKCIEYINKNTILLTKCIAVEFPVKQIIWITDIKSWRHG